MEEARLMYELDELATNEAQFEFREDELIRLTPIPGYRHTYRNEVVIDKDTFIKCYNKWILENDEITQFNTK